MGTFVLSLLVSAAALILLLVKAKKGPAVFRVVGIVMLVFGAILFLFSTVVVIDAGEIGVKVVFGRVSDRVLRNGVHVVPPYAAVVRYPVRLVEFTQVAENLIEARVNNGLTIRLDVTALYTIDPDMAGEVYTSVATSVEDLGAKVFQPILRTEIRNIISQYSSEEVYSSKREQISTEIEESLRAAVAPKGVILDRFMIRAIFLPEEVDRAIQAKIAAQQEAEAMTFKKQKAEQEALIRVVEARGLAQAQEIINSTLTPTYLQHEAIQAYRDLAGSPNTTFVILPTSPTSSGIPLILNAQR